MPMTCTGDHSVHGAVDEFDDMESAVRSYCRLFGCIFSRAQGAVLFDQDGRRYLDFLTGAGALGYGHNDPHIKQAVIAYLQADGVISSLDLHTTAKLAFLRKFRQTILVPRGLEYRVQFCAPTGSDAVEAALKLARKITGRDTIVAFTNAYHGVSLGSLAMTASEHERRSAGVPLQFVTRMPFEGYLGPHVDTISLLHDMLRPGSGIDRPAAIIVETVQAEGGINVASEAWLRRLSEFARRNDILLIVDDIQVGCGRTGTFFSFERAGITPDIVCLSKTIGGIGLPMALVLIRPALDQWGPGDHVGTFRGNNLAFVAASAALDYWQQGGFEAELQERGQALRRRLEAIAELYTDVCDHVRGIGMIQGVVCRDQRLAADVQRAAFVRGLILETSGHDKRALKLLPPLIISAEELDQGLTILRQSIDDVRDAGSAHSAASTLSAVG
jgi:diaminobutyrate-2-oxoglutarate transaminase